MSPRVPILSAKKILRYLKSKGFTEAPARGKGSHHALTKQNDEGLTLLVIVPERKDVPAGTLYSILEQANISKKEFFSDMNIG